MTYMKKTLEIDAIDSFLSFYQIVCENRKKIFSYLYWMAKNWNVVFPSIDKIAQVCSCSRSTVKRALTFFENLGWICRKRRCYRSNLYFVDRSILELNIFNKNTFKKKDPESQSEPITDPIYNVSFSVFNLRYCPLSRGAAKSQKIYGLDFSQEEIQRGRAFIAKYCPKKPLNLTDKDVSDLMKHFMKGKGPAIIINALEAYNNSRVPVSNPIGFLFAMCAKIKRKLMGKSDPPD